MSPFCTEVAFQFHHLPNDVSFPVRGEMKLQYSNSLRTHGKLNALCISATIQTFGCDHRKDNIFLQLHWKDLGLIQRSFCLVSLQFPYCHSPVSLVNRVQHLSSVAELWTLRTKLITRFSVGPDVWRDQTQRNYIKFQKKEWFSNAEPLYKEAGNSFVQHSPKL
jgi:hypothetical protein